MMAGKNRPSDFLPDWARRMRVTNWPMLKLGDVDRAEIRIRAQQIREAGIDAVVLYWMGDEGPDYRHIIFDSSAFGPQEYERVFKPLRMVVEECHRRGIYVIEHHGISFIHKNVPGVEGLTDMTKMFYKQWPMKDWLMHDMLNINPSLGDYAAYSFCPNNPDYRAALMDYLLDVLACGVDGVMPDDALFSPDESYCGCTWCREKFRVETGQELPETKEGFKKFFRNLEDPVYRQWVRSRQKWMGDFHEYLATNLYRKSEKFAYLTCSSTVISPLGYLRSGLDDEQMSRGTNIVHFEICNWYYYFYNWLPDAAEAKVKEAVARNNNATTLTLFYPKNLPEADFVWALAKAWNHNLWLNWYRWVWEDALGSPAILVDAAPGITLADHIRALRYVMWEATQSAAFLNDTETTRTMADVAVLYSRQSANVGGMDLEVYEREWLGWTETLIAANIQMDVILDEDLHQQISSSYRLVIVPNAMALSDRQVSSLLKYVQTGGKILLTCRTGIMDETGVRRAINPFAAVQTPAGDKSRTGSDEFSPLEIQFGKGSYYHLSDGFGRKTVLQRTGARADDTVRENYPPHLSADWRDLTLADRMTEWVAGQLGNEQRVRIMSEKPVHAMAYQDKNGVDIYLVNIQKAFLKPGEKVDGYQPVFVPYDQDTIRIELKMERRPEFVYLQEAGDEIRDCTFEWQSDRVVIHIPSWSKVLCHCRVLWEKQARNA